MRYLNKYSKFNENDSSEEFDIDFAMSKIKEKFSEEEVVAMYDEELLEWVDSSWEEDGYDSEYDWYVDHNNGEAQDVVITQIINWYKKEYNKDLSIDDHSDLFDEIKSEYGI